MQTGILYIVATPIGNLEDITYRAIKILKEVDLIAAEDTRHSAKLLKHYAIQTKVFALHNYNEGKKTSILLEKLQQGMNIALISDAGTPLINDPGFKLVRAAHTKNIKVSPIPGACAAIAALSASGLSTTDFCFEGFLPVKTAALETKLQNLQYENRTIILYEAPHRLSRLLDLILKIFGENRKITIAKELTKTFETILNGSIPQIQTWFDKDPKRLKGEFVILIDGANATETKKQNTTQEVEHIFNLLKTELPPARAAKLTAKITGIKKQELYRSYSEMRDLE